LVVLGEVLGHALGQRGDEDALAGLDALADLAEQVVDLALGGADLDDGVDRPVGRMTCSTTDAAAALQLVVGPGVAET
jgi:hypothetical protein